MTSRLRALGIGLIVCALVVAAAGSVGFSSMSAERNINVAVTNDAGALVGYDSPERIVVIEKRANQANQATGPDSTPANEHANGTGSTPVIENTEHTLVVATNRLHTPIDVVDVEVDAPDEFDVAVQKPPRNIGIGESGEIRATISCVEPVGMADISVTVHVEGEHVAASIFGDTETRSISVTCA